MVENTAIQHPAASYLWYIVVLQGNVEVGALLFSGLLCTIAHLVGQHRRTGGTGQELGYNKSEHQESNIEKAQSHTHGKTFCFGF